MKKQIILTTFLLLTSLFTFAQNYENYVILTHKYKGHIEEFNKHDSGYSIDYPHLYLVYDTIGNRIQLRTYYKRKHYITVMVDGIKVFDREPCKYDTPLTIRPIGKGWILIEGKTKKKTGAPKFKQTYILK